MTQKEILDAIRRCAGKLKRNPRLCELRRMTGLKERQLNRHFGNLTRALQAAGLKPSGSGFTIGPDDLLLDWAAVARKLGKLPTAAGYVVAGRFSQRPFVVRYGRWSQMPREFEKFVAERGSQKEWGDVLAMVSRFHAGEAQAGEAQPGRQAPAADQRNRRQPIPRRRRKIFLLRDRPVYGPPLPLLLPALAHEPVNEAGVIYVFGLLAEKLGFVVQRVQTEFPDCEAIREMERGRWQRVRIEFEFESYNFVKHGHHSKGCDLIVCWVHNWPECPHAIEVIELSRVVKELSG